MLHWTERPLAKALALTLAFLLAFNLIPSGTFRAWAVDTGEQSGQEGGETGGDSGEPQHSATITLKFEDENHEPVTGINLQGMQASLYWEGYETLDEVCVEENNVIIVTRSQFDMCKLSFAKKKFFVDSTWQYVDLVDKGFYFVPMDDTVVTYTVYSPTVKTYYGTVESTTSPVQLLEDVSVKVTKVANQELETPITAITSGGNYEILLPEVSGCAIEVTFSKDGYCPKTTTLTIPSEGNALGTVELNPDSEAPSIVWPTTDPSTDSDKYFWMLKNVNGQTYVYGRADATKCYFTVSDAAGEGEAVSGVKTLYYYKGDLGDSVTPEQLALFTPVSVEEGKPYTAAISEEDGIFLYFVEDAAQNKSDIYKVQYVKDNENPKINGITISSQESGYDTTNIQTLSGSYVSAQTMYLKVQVEDNLSFDHLTLYGREKGSSEEYQSYGTYNLSNNSNNLVVIPIDAADERFSSPKELAVVAYDSAGNYTELKTLSEIGNDIAYSSVAIAKTPASVSIELNNDPVHVDTADGTIYGANGKPEYKITFSGAYGEDLTDLSVTINGTEVLPEEIRAGQQSSGYVFTYTDSDNSPLFTEGLNTITASCKSSIVGSTTTTDSVEFYLDATHPTVSDIAFSAAEGVTIAENNGATYASGPVKVTVTATDSPAVSGGVNKVILYDAVANAETGEITLNKLADGLFENGTAVIAIPSDFEAEKEYSFDIRVYVEDAFSNGITIDPADDAFTFSVPSGKIYISDVLPEITIETDTEGQENNGKTWYQTVPEATVFVQASGQRTIASATITVNGTVVAEYPAASTVQQKWNPNSDDGSESAATVDLSSCGAVDGAYKIEVTAADSLGLSGTKEMTVYIDAESPSVSSSSVSATEGVMLRDLSHGMYANGPVTITVSATDTLSGVKEIVLLADEQEAERKAVTNGTAVFTFTGAGTQTLSVYAVDNVGNGAADNAQPVATILTETDAPSVGISVTGNPESRAVSGKTWYSSDITWQADISDDDDASGIYSYEVFLNGEKLSKDANGQILPANLAGTKTTQTAVTISTAQGKAKEDCSYTIKVVAYDNAGNKSQEKEATVYIDGTAPAVTRFEVTKADASKVLNSYSYGTFANGALSVKVTVQDPAPSGKPASGISAVILYVNGREFARGSVTNNEGSYTFTVPATLAAQFSENITLSAQAIDLSGNVSSITVLSTANSNLLSEKILLENAKPEASVSITGAQPIEKDGRTWYASDVLWSIAIRDTGAGIGSVSISVNGREVAKDRNGADLSGLFAGKDAAVKEATVEIASSSAEIAGDASYTISVTVTDLAGNVSDTYTKQIYRDASAPQISGFRFFDSDGNEINKENAPAAADYGYYFTKDITVKISAADAAPGSGLKSITYYLEDVTTGRTAETTVPVDANGEITITVKAPFKGRIYAKATDYTNNGSAYAAPNGAVLETKASHDEETHITFSKNETELRQPNGVELYSGNVELNLQIADSVSGIRSVEWSVSAPYEQAKNQTGSVTIANDGTISGDAGWTATDKDGNLVTGLSKTLLITHDSNDIVVRVKMTDRAGNQTERQIVFGIDKTAPVVEYEFDNNNADPDFNNVYNDKRTLTITVTERNFVAAEFVCNIKNAYGSVPTISQWTEERDTQDPNNSKYTATVTFVYDGSYTVGLGYTDRAGNRAVFDAVPNFIIDCSKPLVLVTYDNQKAIDGLYYNAFRTATITVTERNFDVARVTYSGNPPKAGNWTANGDEHVLVIYYDEDGTYNFGISVMDKAGNVSTPYDEETFIIDTTPPELELTGISDANRGEVAPVITCTDANYLPGGMTILLQNLDGDTVNKVFTAEEINEENGVSGIRISYKDFDPLKENDNIYTFTIYAVDRAGNKTEKIVRQFSVNRFGSTYDMNGVTERNGVYTSRPTDIVFTEINVDDIDRDSVKIVVIRNSVPRTLEKDVDFTVEEIDTPGVQWKEYRYTIKSSAFSEDGEYSIQVISTDKAGNTNENDENGKNGAITFCVDRVAPKIMVLSPEESVSYAEDTLTASLEIRDNYRLEDVHIYLDDKEVSYSKNGDAYSLEIPQSDARRTLRIVATDAAGNVGQVIVKDFLVSTNMFVRYINNTGAVVGTLAAIAAVGGATLFFLIKRRRKYKA